MRKSIIYFNSVRAGLLTENSPSGKYSFQYFPDYQGPSVSLTMPVRMEEYVFDKFPPFFDGLLPEGVMLDSLLRSLKIDRGDYFSQLLAVGKDLVGAVTAEPYNE